MYQYSTISLPTVAEFKDRGSKFLAFTYPINIAEDCKPLIKKLKDQHPKAVHFCYAYRLGLDKNNYRAVDDGEPSGSAGKPILSQIDSLNLSNILVIVVRYFGGTLLGVPGLINAYKTAAQDALKQAEIITKELMVTYQFEFEYNLTASVQQVIKKMEGVILATDNGLFCTLKVQIPLRLELQIETYCKDLYTLEYKKLDIANDSQ